MQAIRESWLHGFATRSKVWKKLEEAASSSKWDLAATVAISSLRALSKLGRLAMAFEDLMAMGSSVEGYQKGQPPVERVSFL